MPLKILIVGAIVSSFTTASLAEVILGAGAGSRFERSDTEGSYHAVYPFMVEGGASNKQTAILGEYLYYRDTINVSSGIDITLAHESLMLWLRHSLFSESIWGFFIGAGLGAYQDRATTNFLGTGITNMSNWEPEFGLQTGYWNLIVDPVFFEVRLGTRFGSGYNPDPVWTIGAALGAVF